MSRSSVQVCGRPSAKTPKTSRERDAQRVISNGDLEIDLPVYLDQRTSGTDRPARNMST